MSFVKAFQPILLVSSSSSSSPRFCRCPSLAYQPHCSRTLTFSSKKILFGFGARAKPTSTRISNIRCFSGTLTFIYLYCSLISVGIQKRLLRFILSHCFLLNACLIPHRNHNSQSESALTPELKSTLDKVVTSHKVVLFMKGSKDFPQCGFSNTVVQILKSLNVPFETIDILANEILRQGLKEYSSWPTFPQLYIDGEFFGGCDITVEAYQSGQLQEVLEKAMCS